MSTFERQPADLSTAVTADPMFARDAKGNTITRQRTCACGRPFVQLLLSERFITIVERKSARALALLTKQVPDFYVPVHCPRCERKDLRLQASLDGARSLPDHYQDHEHQDHAAD